MTLRTGAWNLKGLSQVAAEDLLEIVVVLHMKRLSQGVPQLFDLTGSDAFAKHLLDRIAGNEVDEQKNQGQNQPQGRQGKQRCRRWRAIRPRIKIGRAHV